MTKHISRRQIGILLSSLAVSSISFETYAASNNDAFIGGMGKPSIVLIHGLGANISESFKTIFALLSQISKTCAFNRKGYGKIKYINEPRNGVLIAEELRQALIDNNIPPPYLIIGHSLGGVYAQYFAKIYASETMGIILIDPAVNMQTSFLAKNNPQEFDVLKMIMRFSGKAINDEFIRSDSLYDALYKLPQFTGKTTILIANKIEGMKNPRAFFDFRYSQLEALAKYYNGKLKIIESGHFIQNEKPDIIINEVKEMLA